MVTEVQKVVIEHLRGLQSAGPIEPLFPHYGICQEIRELLCMYGDHSDLYYSIKQLLQKHPDYTGEPTSPIPHPTKNYSDGYISTLEDKWDPRTDYGRTRREWCKWLADRLEEEKYILGDKQ